MAFEAAITIEDQTYPVRDFYLAVLRETNQKNQPSSSPTWILDVIIDAISDTTITAWMIDPSKQVDGNLNIQQDDGQGSLKTIEFKKSSCFTMVDCFNPSLVDSSCYIRISGEEIHIGSAILTQS